MAGTLRRKKTCPTPKGAGHVALSRGSKGPNTTLPAATDTNATRGTTILRKVSAYLANSVAFGHAALMAARLFRMPSRSGLGRQERHLAAQSGVSTWLALTRLRPLIVDSSGLPLRSLADTRGWP